MSNEVVDHDRRGFLTTAATVAGGAGALCTAVPFISTLKPSARAKAFGAPVEVDISKLKPGDRMTVEWQRKPVWIIRRTEDTVDGLTELDEDVRDPESDQDQQPDYAQNKYRSINPEYLVLIGYCTHLGCSPKMVDSHDHDEYQLGSDWRGGFFCPCHGSRFDLAGRVFKGVPAPTNMMVPPHQYLTDTRILIGDDSGAAS